LTVVVRMSAYQVALLYTELAVGTVCCQSRQIFGIAGQRKQEEVFFEARSASARCVAL
jgi:hypothetical protein